jgi:hypothetical protein
LSAAAAAAAVALLPYLSLIADIISRRLMTLNILVNRSNQTFALIMSDGAPRQDKVLIVKAGIT